MKSQAIAVSMQTPNLAPATINRKEEHMKKRNAFYLFVLVATMLLATLPLSAQILTPTQLASTVLVASLEGTGIFLGANLGASANPIMFQVSVDSLGQSFSYSTMGFYRGQSIQISGAGSFNSVGNIWTFQSISDVGGQQSMIEGTESITQNDTGGYNLVMNQSLTEGSVSPLTGNVNSWGYVGTSGTGPTSFTPTVTGLCQNSYDGMPVGPKYPCYERLTGGYGGAFTVNASSFQSGLSGTGPIGIGISGSLGDSGDGLFVMSVAGASAQLGQSMTAANEFVAGASGSISQIDIGIGTVLGANSFFVALYEASGGEPGTLIEQWSNLTATETFGQCCGLVTISGISGVSVVAGTSYFLVLGPTNLDSSTSDMWNLNSTGVTGTDLYATSGCSNGSGNGCSWNSNGTQTIGAFDIIGTTGCCQRLPGGTTFFSDLGTGSDVYQCCAGWPVSGSGTRSPQSSITGQKK